MMIGFVGLGNMGFAMARNLMRAGHSLQIYNRSPQPLQKLKQEGAVAAISPEMAARNVEIIVTMLPDDNATEEIVFGNSTSRGMIEGLNKNAIHLCASTISPDLANKLAKAHQERGQFYVSAPVFGRPEAAADKKLWFVASGDESCLERCKPIFNATSQGVFPVGANQSLANSIKLAGNFLIASTIENLGEAFSFISKANGDEKQFLKIINSALFKSPLYENYGNLIANGNFDPPGFRLSLGLKDIRLLLAAADQNECPMPSASVVYNNMLSAVANGKGDLDWSAFGKLLSKAAGIH